MIDFEITEWKGIGVRRLSEPILVLGQIAERSFVLLYKLGGREIFLRCPIVPFQLPFFSREVRRDVR